MPSCQKLIGLSIDLIQEESHVHSLPEFILPRDPHTFSEGTWALQAYINSLQSPSEKVLGSLGTGSGVQHLFSIWKMVFAEAMPSASV